MTVRIKLNSRGVAQLLKSKEILADVTERGERIARAAGPGHRVDAGIGRTRARATVITDTFEAMYAEATDRNLTRAIDAGR